MIFINLMILGMLFTSRSVIASCESGTDLERAQCYAEKCKNYYERCKALCKSRELSHGCRYRNCGHGGFGGKFGNIFRINLDPFADMDRKDIDSKMTSKIIERVKSGDTDGTIKMIEIGDDGKEQEFHIAFKVRDERKNSELSDEGTHQHKDNNHNEKSNHKDSKLNKQ